jgi:hypothetical protein
MRPRIEKAEPIGKATKSTSNSKARNAPEVTARMHFYAVRSTGDQLRWAGAPKTDKKRDRMVGR